jgi:predicted nucleic acid-binding protein
MPNIGFAANAKPASRGLCRSGETAGVLTSKNTISSLEEPEERYRCRRSHAATADFDASIRACAKTTGLAIGAADRYIAATAAAHGFMVARRDTGPFEAAGVPLISPWVNGLPFSIPK